MLKNMVEVLLERKLDHMLEDEDCCKCAQCKEDMMAYALNKLPPHYVSTDQGKLFAKAEELSWSYEFDITKALAMAVNVVSKNPRH